MFVKKLDLWMKNVDSKHSYRMFEVLTGEPNDEFSQEIVHHHSLLKTELIHYFLDMTCFANITDPFSVDPADLPVETREQEELIDIQSDENIDEAQGMLSYKLLGEHGLLILNTSPLCCSPATDFPLYIGMQAGVLSHDEHQVKEPEPSCCAGHDFLCAVSKVMPCINQLVEKKQLHSSH